jgi:hypothetical protein
MGKSHDWMLLHSWPSGVCGCVFCMREVSFLRDDTRLFG